MTRDEQLIRAALEMAAKVLEGYDEYDQQLCCDGRMCGCQGSTVHQMMQHIIRAIDPAELLAKVGADDRNQLTIRIAQIIDHPSVYMGGPSRNSMRIANIIMNELFPTPPQETDQ